MLREFEQGDRVHAPFTNDETGEWENCKGRFVGVVEETGDFVISFGLDANGSVVNDPTDGHSVSVVEKLVAPKHVIGHYRYVKVETPDGEMEIPAPLNY
jgi:hypothetical protein